MKQALIMPVRTPGSTVISTHDPSRTDQRAAVLAVATYIEEQAKETVDTAHICPTTVALSCGADN
jgi:hypothetical protein